MRAQLFGGAGATVLATAFLAAGLLVTAARGDDAERPPSHPTATRGEQLHPPIVAPGKGNMGRFLPPQTLDQSYRSMSMSLTMDFSQTPFPLKEGDQVRFSYEIHNEPTHVLRMRVQFKPIGGTDYDGHTRDEWFLVGGPKYPGERPVHTVIAPAGLKGSKIAKIVLRWAYGGGPQSPDLRAEVRINEIAIKTGGQTIVYNDSDKVQSIAP
jgi:hypothetical protein